MVYTQTVSLCVSVRKQPSLQHLIRRKPDSRNNICRVKGSLLHVGKIVFRISVQFKLTYRDKRKVAFWPYFGQIKGVDRVIVCFFLRHDLYIHLPFGEVLPLYRLKQIPLVRFPVGPNQVNRLFVGEVFYSLLRSKMEFHPITFVFRIVKAKGMATKTMHMPIGLWNAPVAHHDGHLMERFRKKCPEVPVVVGASQI